MAEVDHIVPLRDGGQRLEWSNLQSLCLDHHNGWKRKLEAFARAKGLIDRISEWCRKPDTRPGRFRLTGRR
jgi:5-methylcytosine-specific restriction endonuclease McrA